MNTPASNLARSGRSAAGKFTLTTLSLLLLAAVSPSAKANDNRAPDVPATLVVPDGNKVHFHAYAVGVQIYSWNGSSWVFLAPEAVLFANAGANGEVAIHYAGPTWESNSGSKVVGARVAGATVDPTALPWLLLQAKTTEGPRIFSRTAYIQRGNTTGRVRPAT